MFSSEFIKHFKNIYFVEHLQMAASVGVLQNDFSKTFVHTFVDLRQGGVAISCFSMISVQGSLSYFSGKLICGKINMRYFCLVFINILLEHYGCPEVSP